MKKQLLFLLFIAGAAITCTNRPPENEPAIIEIVTEEAVDPEQLSQFLRSHDWPGAVYHWENHGVLYAVFPDLARAQKRLEAAFPRSEIRIYDKPFYAFDRNRCGDKPVKKPWSHTIMTANLVAGETMQQEYMDYHAGQQVLFPEVAQGFCNAGFQQVLVFRNGRQLLLVISIPEGENLDDLNPKTTENNPRVDEWNAIMAKYQEGIDGAPEGETWIILSPCAASLSSSSSPN
jgi:hypothetical protein